jgi:O-methyltransferase
MIKRMIRRLVRSFGYDLVQVKFTQAANSLILKPIDPIAVEILSDKQFQASCQEVYDLTLLDTPRLANLWQLCRLTDPGGQMIEVGTYRGGGALHLANSCPDRNIFVCDSFAGFQSLDPRLDQVFDLGMFKDTSKQAVQKLFQDRHRKATLIDGYFPQSCAGIDLAPLSFAHIDVDTYQGTRESLEFLSGRMMDHSLMVLDDYCRTAEGVNQAITEFLTRHPEWKVLPLFPSQALVVSKHWFKSLD